MDGIELTPDAPVGRVVDRGVTAADAGFDAVFVSAHYNNRDPFAVLARLAARTDDVRLGPGVVNPLETHPVTLASRVGTVAEQADGRAVFGVGPGDPATLSNLGLGSDRGLAPVLEAATVARKLFAGERVDHDGAFVADGAGLNFDVPGPLPVFVGGEGPDMCRMAAAHADGLLYNGAHPDDLAWARERVEEGLAERTVGTAGGGDGSADAHEPVPADAFDLLAYASVSVAADGERARRAARRPVAFIAAGAPPAVCERHGVDAERAAAVADAIADGRFSDADDLVTPAMVDAFAVAGTPPAVADRLADLLVHADGVVVGAPLGPDPDDAVAMAAEALRDARAR
ncbi:MAG: 5,10-methylenetetrahydromethanopterin reductase [Halobacteriaceae archaeon]